MNAAQASRAWEVSEYEVRSICREMDIDAENIPEDTVPVYLPDRTYDDNPQRFYLYLMDVISNSHMQIRGIDADILETCVAQLKEKKLIALKTGAKADSLDYRDYVISAERELYNEWYNSMIKHSVTLVEKIVSYFKG